MTALNVNECRTNNEIEKCNCNHFNLLLDRLKFFFSLLTPTSQIIKIETRFRSKLMAKRNRWSIHFTSSVLELRALWKLRAWNACIKFNTKWIFQFLHRNVKSFDKSAMLQMKIVETFVVCSFYTSKSYKLYVIFS